MKVIKVVGIIVEKEGKFLILLRSENKPQPLTWAIPSGKVDEGEELLAAAVREVGEEVGALLPSNQFEFMYDKVYDFSKDGYKVHYHVFRVLVEPEFESKINESEHKEHRWATPSEVLRMENLIDGFTDVIARVFFPTLDENTEINTNEEK